MPRGPLLDNNRYRIRPRTTVGIPSMALKEPLRSLFPGKDDRPRRIAMGRLHREESNVANPEMYIDLSVTEKTSGSPLSIKTNA